MTFGMSLERARLIATLLVNAGWIDDADELLGNIIDDKTDGGPQKALWQAMEVDSLINAINLVLPKEEQLIPNITAIYYGMI